MSSSPLDSFLCFRKPACGVNRPITKQTYLCYIKIVKSTFIFPIILFMTWIIAINAPFFACSCHKRASQDTNTNGKRRQGSQVADQAEKKRLFHQIMDQTEEGFLCITRQYAPGGEAGDPYQEMVCEADRWHKRPFPS
jgi:hypothetical protein